MSAEKIIVLNERTRFGSETGAGLMRNRCAFTSKDMAEEFDSAFTYAIVMGWDTAMQEVSERWGWDAELVQFLKNSRRRFKNLPDRKEHDE